MPNTPHGLPYPPATDPVAQGAAAIQALAVAVDSYVLAQDRIAGPRSSPRDTAGFSTPGYGWFASPVAKITVEAGIYVIRVGALINFTDNVPWYLGILNSANAAIAQSGQTMLPGATSLRSYQRFVTGPISVAADTYWLGVVMTAGTTAAVYDATIEFEHVGAATMTEFDAELLETPPDPPLPEWPYLGVGPPVPPDVAPPHPEPPGEGPLLGTF